jgi:hypothetical protein
MNKLELVVAALQQRIGELVSNYETQIALLRAELTELTNLSQEKEKAIQDYSNSLEEKTGT